MAGLWGEPLTKEMEFQCIICETGIYKAVPSQEVTLQSTSPCIKIFMKCAPNVIGDWSKSLSHINRPFFLYVMALYIAIHEF